MSRAALYTTIFPGVEPFLAQWWESVAAQLCGDFEVWVGLDNLSPTDVEVAVGRQISANWVVAEHGSSPASVRQCALDQIVGQVDYVIFVDSDDILDKTRVEAALRALAKSDVNACALEFADENGRGEREFMSLDPGAPAHSPLPRWNIYGLSNSAYRVDTLRACLPIPPRAVMVDWFLVTRAWLMGARMSFDWHPRMLYRQHRASMARVRPPFEAEQIKKDADLVLLHFALIRDALPPDAIEARIAEIDEVAVDVARFCQIVLEDGRMLDRYVEELNASDAGRYWWESVAYPRLRHMWNG